MKFSDKTDLWLSVGILLVAIGIMLFVRGGCEISLHIGATTTEER